MNFRPLAVPSSLRIGTSCAPFTPSVEVALILPAAMPVTFLPPTLIPPVVTEGPPVITRPLPVKLEDPVDTPFVLTTVLPAVTLPSAPRSSLLFRCTNMPCSLAVVVILLLPPVTLRVWSARRTLPVPVVPLVCSVVLYSCRPFTASVETAVTSPSATFVIFLPAVLMPPVVTEGPLVITRPVLFTLVAPVVTLPSLPRLMSLANFTVSTPFLPLWAASTPMLPSVRLLVAAPPFTVTWLSRATVALPSSPLKVRPLVGLLIAICSLLSTTFVAIPLAPTTWIASSTWAVALLLPS